MNKTSNQKLHCKGCEAWDRIEAQYAELSRKYGEQRDDYERLRAALLGVMECSGTGTRHYHIARDALRGAVETKSSEADALDAAKWRALRNCARITAMGSAGLGPKKAADDYAHLTLNFWTGLPAGEDSGPVYAREWLDGFVEKALRAMPAAQATLCSCGWDEEFAKITWPDPHCSVHAEKAKSPPSENCEHGIPRRFCTAVHADSIK